MGQPAILSIDQGTSGSKAIVFSLEGDILASYTANYDINHPGPGQVEIDPRALLHSVYSACRGALGLYTDAGGSPIDIRTIGISNQRESFLVWDKEGRPLSRVLVWQCKRSADYCEELSRDDAFVSLIRRRTGLLVDPYFSGTKAAVLAASDPGLSRKITAGEAYFGTIDTWLLWELTGGKVFATDHSNASRTMLFDINRLAWDDDILERFGLTGLHLPETRYGDAGFGRTDINSLLPDAVPVGAVIGDSHAAAFGEGLFRPGEAKVTLGTGSSILMNVGSSPAASENGMVSTVCWSTGGRVDYALEGIIVSCGSTITWLRDKLGMIGSSREIDELAADAGDAGTVYFIPGFSGIGAPWWKLQAKASIVGLDFGHDRRHIARAALESIPFQVADVLTAMTSDADGSLRLVKADGGITVSSLVMESVSALVGCPVEIPSMQQASAWGAALMAGLGAGLYPDIDAIDSIIAKKDTDRINTKPDPRLLERYQGWRNLLQDY